ncbi:T9SS C-terminal target domain-containing protein [Bacteroidetes/Chlorobi group bacterium Naka2016]|nr:MAG: T9SS C-terminal target domain-containing protein [Bacteroidetes/Chlorobi group bacterium Naka2016]
MRKILLLIAWCLTFLCSPLYSQTLIWQQTDFSLTGNVNLVHVGPNGLIYAGSFNTGVYVTSDKGQSWTTRNNGLSNLQVFAFLNVADTMFVGTLDGVYKSTNYGMNWEPSNEGLFDKYINALAITKNQKMLVGTLYNGLFISTNFGRSWTQMNNEFKNKSVNCILAKNDGFVLVGTTSGLYRATQMFDFWGKVDADLKNNTNINTIAVDSTGNIYVGTNNGYIYKSINNGVSWTEVYQIANTPIYKIVVSPQNVVYAATYGKGVLRSKNAGATWEEVNDGLYNQYTTGIIALSNRELFVSTWGNGVFYGKEYEISTLVEGEYCTGNQISIDYYVTVQFNSDNYFIAQLSDNSGSFKNPIELGRVQSTTSGTITGTIPNNVSTGILYRVRVISTSPPLIGADNRKNIRIYKGLNPVISGKATVCENDIETYSSPVKIGVISTWSVTNGEILNIDETTNTITIQWKNVGIGEVKLNQVLESGKCADSNKIVVTIHPKPEKPVITRRGYTLYSSSKTGNQWFRFDQPIPNATADSLNVENPGLYYVQVTNEFGCKSEMSDPFDFYYNAVDDENETFVIYPNPVSTKLFLIMPENVEEISITDLFGRNLMNIKLDNNTTNTSIDISNLSNGTYFLIAKTTKGINIKRFNKIN